MRDRGRTLSTCRESIDEEDAGEDGDAGGGQAGLRLAVAPLRKRSRVAIAPVWRRSSLSSVLSPKAGGGNQR